MLPTLCDVYFAVFLQNFLMFKIVIVFSSHFLDNFCFFVVYNLVENFYNEWMYIVSRIKCGGIIANSNKLYDV